MRLKVTLDRIENDKAVLFSESGQKSYIISLALLPKEVKEGDVVIISANIDKEATRKSKEEISKLINKLSRKGQDQQL